MSARENIAAHFASDTLADQLLDAYRDEVLDKAADWLDGIGQHHAAVMMRPDPDDPQPPASDVPAAPAKSTARVLCTHRRVLLQDSCPGCDAMEETPHTADPVSVYSQWAKTEVRRCRQCGMSRSHHIHRGGA